MTVQQRERRIRELLGVRGHMDGCPGEDDPAVVRVEAFEALRPVIERQYNEAAGERLDVFIRNDVVSVCRCVDCGGQRVLERSLEALLTPTQEAQR